MVDTSEILVSWAAYFDQKVSKRKNITDLYLKYVADLTEKGYPPVFNFEHLALLIGVDSAVLASIVVSSEKFYRSFHLPKRTGGYREIDVPVPVLLEAQKWIKKEILDKVGVHESAHGFIRGKSIVSNAKEHLGAGCILKMDIEDFFPSIKIRRGISIFLNIGFPPKVSYYLAALCFREGALPQGSPASPSISNIVAKRLDARLLGLAKANNLKYTRYADDIVFSGDQVGSHLISSIVSIMHLEGFRPNTKKTQIVCGRTKKIVTGISISSGKLALPRASVRKIKQEAHFLLKRGYWLHVKATGNRDPILVERLLGKVGFWLQIDPENKTAQKLYTELIALSNTTDAV